MKNLAVKVAGTGQITDVSIEPGTTAREILRAAKLPDDYWLTLDGKAPFLGSDEDVYPQVSDGQKVFASKTMEVGT